MNPQTDTPESAEAKAQFSKAEQSFVMEGIHCFIAGTDRSECPYDDDTEAQYLWRTGWDRAKNHGSEQSDTADANAALSLKLQRCEEALNQSENTLRSLIGTLQTVDSDDRYRARQERREPLLHTMEIKQAEQCRKQIAAALTHPTRNEGEKKV